MPDCMESGPNGASLPVRRALSVVGGGTGIVEEVVVTEPIVQFDLGCCSIRGGRRLRREGK